ISLSSSTQGITWRALSGLVWWPNSLDDPNSPLCAPHGAFQDKVGWCIFSLECLPMPKMYVVSLSDAERLLLHQTIKKGKTILYRLTGESLKEMRRSEPALTVAFTETMVRLLARRVLDSDARVPRGSDGHETADTQSALPHPAHSPCPESA